MPKLFPSAAVAGLGEVAHFESADFVVFLDQGSPLTCYKVSLATFLEEQALTANAGENAADSAAIDTANGYFYVGTVTAPGRVVKFGDPDGIIGSQHLMMVGVG